MASIPSSPDVERIDVSGAEATQCLDLIKKLQLDPNYNQIWAVQAIFKINKNRNLRLDYEQRKALLGQGVKENFAFACAGKNRVVSIARDGVLIKASRHAIGDTNRGINLCRWSDVQLKAAASCGYTRVNLLVFKIAYCKQKKVEAREGNDISPDPDYDSHISTNAAVPGEEIGDQLRKSQIYIYEYGENNELLRRPRQIFPLVVIQYLREDNPVTAPKITAPKLAPVPATVPGVIQINTATSQPVQGQLHARYPQSRPMQSVLQPLGNGNSSILAQTLLQSSGSGTSSGTSSPAASEMGVPQSPRYRVILPQMSRPSSQSSSNSVPQVRPTAVSVQYASNMANRPVQQNGSPAVMFTNNAPFGQLRGVSLTNDTVGGGLRMPSSVPSSPQYHVVTLPVGNSYMQLRLPGLQTAGIPVSSTTGFQKPSMPPQLEAHSVVQVKTEQAERSRPINDNIDLTEDEIDESNVIEIAPIEEPEDDESAECAPVNTANISPTQPVTQSNIHDKFATAANDVLGDNTLPSLDAGNVTTIARSSLAVYNNMSQAALNLSSSPQPVTSSMQCDEVAVPASIQVSSVSSHRPLISAPVVTVSSSSTVNVTTVASSEPVPGVKTSSHSQCSDMPVHIDLTIDLDEVVEDLVHRSGSTSGVHERLEENRSAASETSAENLTQNDLVPETVSGKRIKNPLKAETVAQMKVKGSSSLLPSDVILLDSDDEDYEAGPSNPMESDRNSEMDEDRNSCPTPLLDTTDTASESNGQAVSGNILDRSANDQSTVKNIHATSEAKRTGPQGACPQTNENVTVKRRQESNSEVFAETSNEVHIEETSNERTSKDHSMRISAEGKKMEEGTTALPPDVDIRNKKDDSETPVSAAVSQSTSEGESPDPSLAVESGAPGPNEEVSDGEPSQELEDSVAEDAFDEGQVVTVRAHERRPHETIFEGTVFKIGEDGSVELAIERFFIRDRTKYVLSEDEDEESQNEHEVRDPGVNDKEDRIQSVTEAEPMEVEPEQGQNQEAESTEVPPTETLMEDPPHEKPSSCENKERGTSKSQEVTASNDANVRGPAKNVAKKKKVSKCPFVRSGAKRKKKTPKAGPVKFMAVEAPAEPMPEPEKKRVQGRRVAVDINKLREEALARAAASAKPCLPADSDSDISDNEDDMPAAEVEQPSSEVDAGDDQDLGLKVVDVRSEVDVPVKVEIDTAEDNNYDNHAPVEYLNDDHGEVTYLNVPSPDAELTQVDISDGEHLFTLSDIKQSPVCKVKSPAAKVIAFHGSEKFQPIVRLKNLTSEEIRRIQGDLRENIQENMNTVDLTQESLDDEEYIGTLGEQDFVKKESERPEPVTELKVMPSGAHVAKYSPVSSDCEMASPVKPNDADVPKGFSSDDAAVSRQSESKLSLKRKKKVTHPKVTPASSTAAMYSPVSSEGEMTSPVKLNDADIHKEGNNDAMVCRQSESKLSLKRSKKLVSKTSGPVVKAETAAKQSKKDNSTISPVKIVKGLEKKKEASSQSTVESSIELLQDNLSSENEFLEATPTKQDKQRQKKKVKVLKSSVEEKIGDQAEKSRTRKLPKLKKSKRIIESDSDDEVENKSKSETPLAKSNNLAAEECEGLVKVAAKTIERVPVMGDISDERLTDVEKESVKPSKAVSKKDGKNHKKSRKLSSEDSSGDSSENEEVRREPSLKRERKQSRVLSDDIERLSESNDGMQKKHKKMKVDTSPVISRTKSCVVSTDSERLSESNDGMQKKHKKTKMDTSPVVKRKRSRVVSTDSERLSENSHEGVQKKERTSKVISGCGVKKHGHDRSKSSSDGKGIKPKPKLSITPRDKLHLKPGAVLPLPRKDPRRKSFEQIPTPEFTDSEEETVPCIATEKKCEPPAATKHSAVTTKELPTMPKETTAMSKETPQMAQDPVPSTSGVVSTTKVSPTSSKPCKTPKKLKPNSKLEQMRQKMETVLPQYLFKPQKPELPNVKSTVERLRKLSGSEQAEENKKRAIELYRKNPVKPCHSNQKGVTPKKNAGTVNAPRHSSVHDSNKINGILQDMMMKEEGTRRNSKEGKREIRHVPVQDVQQQSNLGKDEGSENKESKEKCVDEFPSLPDVAECGLALEDNSNQTSEGGEGQDLPELYAKREEVLKELLSEGEEELYVDSEAFKAKLKQKKSQKIVKNPEVFNGNCKATEDGDSSGLEKTATWMAEMKEISSKSVGFSKAKEYLDGVALTAVGETPQMKTVNKQPSESDVSMKPKRKMIPVHLLTSEELQLWKQEQLPSSFACGSSSSSCSSSSSALIRNSCRYTECEEWINQGIKHHRRKPPIFRPNDPEELLKYLDTEKDVVVLNITTVLSRIKKLARLLKRTKTIDLSKVSANERQDVTKWEGMLAEYELEQGKLTVDKEMIDKDLADCRGDPVVLPYYRLPDDVLLPHEISARNSCTNSGTLLYTLSDITKSAYQELQGFKLDIELTNKEVRLKPEKGRLASLRSNLKWLHIEREKRLLEYCNFTKKHEEDLTKKVEFYSELSEKFKREVSENAERIFYLDDRIEQCCAIVDGLHSLERRQKLQVNVRCDGPKDGTSHLQPLGSPRSFDCQQTQAQNVRLDDANHTQAANSSKLETPETGAISLELKPVMQYICDYEPIAVKMKELYPDWKMIFTRTITLPKSEPYTYSVECENLRNDPRLVHPSQRNPNPAEGLLHGTEVENSVQTSPAKCLTSPSNAPHQSGACVSSDKISGKSNISPATPTLAPIHMQGQENSGTGCQEKDIPLPAKLHSGAMEERAKNSLDVGNKLSKSECLVNKSLSSTVQNPEKDSHKVACNQVPKADSTVAQSSSVKSLTEETSTSESLSKKPSFSKAKNASAHSNIEVKKSEPVPKKTSPSNSKDESAHSDIEVKKGEPMSKKTSPSISKNESAHSDIEVKKSEPMKESPNKVAKKTQDTTVHKTLQNPSSDKRHSPSKLTESTAETFDKPLVTGSVSSKTVTEPVKTSERGSEVKSLEEPSSTRSAKKGQDTGEKTVNTVKESTPSKLSAGVVPAALIEKPPWLRNKETDGANTKVCGADSTEQVSTSQSTQKSLDLVKAMQDITEKSKTKPSGLVLSKKSGDAKLTTKVNKSGSDSIVTGLSAAAGKPPVKSKPDLKGKADTRRSSPGPSSSDRNTRRPSVSSDSSSTSSGDKTKSRRGARESSANSGRSNRHCHKRDHDHSENLYGNNVNFGVAGKTWGSLRERMAVPSLMGSADHRRSAPWLRGRDQRHEYQGVRVYQHDGHEESSYGHDGHEERYYGHDGHEEGFYGYDHDETEYADDHHEDYRHDYHDVDERDYRHDYHGHNSGYHIDRGVYRGRGMQNYRGNRRSGRRAWKPY